MICRILFSKFADVLPTSNCARAFGNLSSIFLVVNILIPLPFCCLLKFMDF